MTQTSTRPQRRREFLRKRGWPLALNNRLDQQQPVRMYRHIGPSKYMPHIGKKQLAKAAARVG